MENDLKEYKVCKKTILLLMNRMGFEIEDIAYINGVELVAKRMNHSTQLVWWDMRAEGSGFAKFFRGSIKKACTQQLGDNYETKRIEQNFGGDRRGKISA